MRRIVLVYILMLMVSFVWAQSNEFQEVNHFFDSINKVEKIQKIDAVFQEMVKVKNFSGAIIVGLDTELLYMNYNGYANWETKTKIEPNSTFELASVSKQFTAVAILKLYEQGLLKLTDTIQKFIPDFPYRGITIHHLLCHRSGLPEYFDFAEVYQKDDKTTMMDNDSLVRMMQIRRPKRLSRPDVKFEYNNTGYALLAKIVEIVSGQQFSDFVQENIFNPYGMSHSYFYLKGKGKDSLETAGHKSNYRVYKRDIQSGVYGDKGVFTTAEDMWNWNKALYAGKVLQDTTLQLAYTPKNKDMLPIYNYGYGWRLAVDADGGRLVFHGGLWNGNNTLFSRRLCDKSFVMIFSNVYNKSFGGRGDQILGILKEM